MNWTLGELAERLRGALEGPTDLPIGRPVTAQTPDPNGLAFAEADKYLAIAEASGVGAVLIWPDARAAKVPAIRVKQPRVAWLSLLHACERPYPTHQGVHPSAQISPEATVHPSATIGPYVVVEAGADIGAGVRVFPCCYVGEGCTLGPDTVLFPGAVLYRDVKLGARCIVHAGAVLGADGFGFWWDGTRRVKIPQVGEVRIEDEVEIGANACVDRATAGDTWLGEGVKIDNLVQIGHNNRIGAHSVLAGLTGLAGSCTVGERVLMGGQVAVRDGVTLGDDVVLAGRTGIMQDVLDPGEYFGTPAHPAREAMRSLLYIHRLHEMNRKIRDLEREIERLKERPN